MSREYPSDWDSRRKRVRERDNHTCQNCGRKGGSSGSVNLEVHHIVPVRNGGSHRTGNLRTLCKGCHDAITYDQNAPTATNQWSELEIGEVEPPPYFFAYCVFCFVLSILGSMANFGFVKIFVIFAFVSSPYFLFIWVVVGRRPEEP